MTNSLPSTFHELPRQKKNSHVARRLLRRGLPGLAALLCSLAIGRDATAQPGAGPLVLRVAASARTLGMANAGLLSNDADALFYNPALLFNARGMAISMQGFGSFGTAGALSNAVTIGSLNIGVGAQVLNWSASPLPYRELMRAGAAQLADSGGIAASSTAITLGIARTFKGKRLAISAKYVEDRFPSAHDGTLAFDVGMMGPSIGPGVVSFVLRNLGQGLRLGGEEGQLPTQLGVGWGGSYNNFTMFDMGMQTQLTIDRDGFVRPAGGMEIGYVPIEGVSFTARAGLRLPREVDEPLATGGLGFTVDRFSLDYAIEPFRGGRPISHRLGIRIK